MTQSSLVESSCLVVWSSPSRPLRVVPSSSHPRRVTLVESSSSSQRVSWSNSRQVMVPHRVILGESSCVRDVLVESWGAFACIIYFWASVERCLRSQKRWVIRKFECLFIYFWASVERWLRSQKRWVIRKMTPFPETVSDPLSESSSCSYGASSSHPLGVIESLSSPGVKIESSSSSAEVPLENSSVYLFIFEGR